MYPNFMIREWNRKKGIDLLKDNGYKDKLTKRHPLTVQTMIIQMATSLIQYHSLLVLLLAYVVQALTVTSIELT